MQLSLKESIHRDRKVLQTLRAEDGPMALVFIYVEIKRQLEVAMRRAPDSVSYASAWEKLNQYGLPQISYLLDCFEEDYMEYYTNEFNRLRTTLLGVLNLLV